MAAPVKPALKMALGKESYLWVPAIANIAAPTVVELTAAGSFNLSCSLFGDQEGPTATTNKVTLPQLLCETQTYEVNGPTQHSAPDFQASFDPQAAAGSDGKKAWASMPDNSTGFLVRRQGVDSNTDVATGQFVDVWPGQLGVKVPTKTATDASGVFAFTVGVAVTGAPQFNVALT